MISINTNINAMVATRYLGLATTEIAKSSERLSTGKRINHAADDAAGLSIATGLDSQIRGMAIAANNAQSAVSMLSTADDALGQTTAILQKMRDLAVAAANGDGNLSANETFKQLQGQLDSIASNTSFNGKKLLDGTLDVNFQVGANSANQAAFTLTAAKITGYGSTTNGDGSGITGLDSAGLNVGSAALTGGLTTQTAATTALAAIDKALTGTSTVRSVVGAQTNAFTRTVEGLGNQVINLTEAKSRILDVDVAAETAALSKNQILAQTSAAMLASANQGQATTLRLLLGI